MRRSTARLDRLTHHPVRGAVRTMHRMVSEAIEARRRSGPRRESDLLDYMLAAQDPNTDQRMNEADLLNNMQFFIVAGHETTALSLAWALHLLSHDLEAQARASAEARAAIGERAATADDLPNAPYIEQVLEEAMRLYPPVGLLARNVLAPDQLYDRDIRPNDTVFLNIYAMHRHAQLWDRPEAFNPDNFSPETKKTRDRYQYLPFGAGPRVCVGANFAMMQAQIILTTLLARFSFKPAGPPPTPVMHMTIRPEPGVRLKARAAARAEAETEGQCA